MKPPKIPSLFPYPGGQAQRGHVIERLLPLGPLNLVVGYGGVCSIYQHLYIMGRIKSALIIEINRNLGDLYNAIALHKDEFVTRLGDFPAGDPELFSELKESYKNKAVWDSLSRIEHAVRFYWMALNSYAGSGGLPNTYIGPFVYSKDHQTIRYFNPSRIVEHINTFMGMFSLAERRTGNCLEILKDVKYQSHQLTWYMHPPYTNRAHYYPGSPKTDLKEYERLLDLCEQSESKVLIVTDFREGDGLEELVGEGYSCSVHEIPKVVTMGHQNRSVAREVGLVWRYVPGDTKITEYID